MLKLMCRLALLFLAFEAALAQISPGGFVAFVSVDPTGGCNAVYITQNVTTGVLSGCVEGNWQAVGGGSGTFTALTGDATSTATGGATTVIGVHGAVVPLSAVAVATNASRQLVAASVQGSGDTKVMLAGTVSGLAATLCTDANGGATTTGCSAGGGGNTTSTSLTTNTLPKANGANSIIDSTFTDNGTTAATSEPFQAPSVTTTGTTAGIDAFGSGTQTIPGTITNMVGFIGPASAPSGNHLYEPALLGATANNSVVLYNTESGSISHYASTTNAPALSAANMGSFPTLNQNTTGNAATATNLATYPALCTGGQVSTGYTTGSPPTNNCVTPGGSGISLTTIGSSGAATLIGSVLNIPVYGGGSGTVTSVGFTGGLISVANPTTTPALTVAGTSGGIPYFASASTWASSAAGAAKQLMLWGGAGAAPTGIDFPDAKTVPAANCIAGTAGAAWSNATSNFTATCRAGSNNLGGALQAIPNTGTATAQFMIELPLDWDSAAQPYINIFYGSGANTSGTVIWTVSSACSKEDGSVTDDPAFNAESAFASQTMAAASRTWAKNGQFTAITSGNNCIPGSSLIIKVGLTGTATSAINAYQAVVTIPRLLVVQAQ